MKPESTEEDEQQLQELEAAADAARTAGVYPSGAEGEK